MPLISPTWILLGISSLDCFNSSLTSFAVTIFIIFQIIFLFCIWNHLSKTVLITSLCCLEPFHYSPCFKDKIQTVKHREPLRIRTLLPFKTHFSPTSSALLILHLSWKALSGSLDMPPGFCASPHGPHTLFSSPAYILLVLGFLLLCSFSSLCCDLFSPRMVLLVPPLYSHSPQISP